MRDDLKLESLGVVGLDELELSATNGGFAWIPVVIGIVAAVVIVVADNADRIADGVRDGYHAVAG